MQARRVRVPCGHMSAVLPKGPNCELPLFGTALTYPAKFSENVIRDVSETAGKGKMPGQFHTLEVAKWMERSVPTKGPSWGMHTCPTTVHTIFYAREYAEKT